MIAASSEALHHMPEGPIEFVVLDADGHEVDWIDPVDAISVEPDRYVVETVYGTYEVEALPKHQYMLRNRQQEEDA